MDFTSYLSDFIQLIKLGGRSSTTVNDCLELYLVIIGVRPCFLYLERDPETRLDFVRIASSKVSIIQREDFYFMYQDDGLKTRIESLDFDDDCQLGEILGYPFPHRLSELTERTHVGMSMEFEFQGELRSAWLLGMMVTPEESKSAQLLKFFYEVVSKVWTTVPEIRSFKVFH